MPSNKDKVTSYLENDEKQALDELCKENDYSHSQGVAHLIRNYLIENDETPESKAVEPGYEERFNLIELALNVTGALGNQTARKNEKLEEQITELQCTVEKLQKEVQEKPPQYFTDDEIASVTGRRLQEVYEWRLGIRKPRGCRILEKLEPYEIVDGQWRKKKES